LRIYSDKARTSNLKSVSSPASRLLSVMFEHDTVQPEMDMEINSFVPSFRGISTKPFSRRQSTRVEAKRRVSPFLLEKIIHHKSTTRLSIQSLGFHASLSFAYQTIPN
jgi:hypothetical protein